MKSPETNTPQGTQLELGQTFNPIEMSDSERRHEIRHLIGKGALGFGYGELAEFMCELPFPDTPDPISYHNAVQTGWGRENSDSRKNPTKY